MTTDEQVMRATALEAALDLYKNRGGGSIISTVVDTASAFYDFLNGDTK